MKNYKYFVSYNYHQEDTGFHGFGNCVLKTDSIIDSINRIKETTITISKMLIKNEVCTIGELSIVIINFQLLSEEEVE